MNNLLSDNDTKAVHQILIEQLSVEPSQLTFDARIQQDLGADSLDIMEIILAAEEHFHISIPDEEAEKVSTVGDLLAALANLQENLERRVV
jgi:acyl carrier protein